MKEFLAVIKIIGLGGTNYHQKNIKARTLKAAKNQAYLSIGNQTGEIVLIGELEAPGIVDAAHKIFKENDKRGGL